MCNIQVLSSPKQTYLGTSKEITKQTFSGLYLSSICYHICITHDILQTKSRRVFSSRFRILQAAFWLIVPKLIKEEQIKLIMTILLLIFLFQFLPKVYHSICLMRRMQKVTGYLFGTIWWGFALNLIAYFIASHVSSSIIIKLYIYSSFSYSFVAILGCWWMLVRSCNTTCSIVSEAAV